MIRLRHVSLGGLPQQHRAMLVRPALQWVLRVIGLVALKVIWGLVTNALAGWGDDQIASALHITSPTPKWVAEELWLWGVPLLVLCLASLTYHRLTRANVPRPARVPHSSSKDARTGNAPQVQISSKSEPIEWPTVPTISFDRLDGGYNADQFIVYAKVTGNREIKLDDAYIISAVTGAALPLKIRVGLSHLTLDQVNPIPPNARFELCADFRERNAAHGIPEREFLTNWGAIDLVVQYGGQDHRTKFRNEDILAAWAKVHPTPSPSPHVTRKSASSSSAAEPSAALPRQIPTGVSEQIAPRLKCSFVEGPECVVKDIPMGRREDGGPRKGTFYRLKVEMSGPTPALSCYGRLHSIKHDGKEICSGLTIQLPFSKSDMPDAVNKAIHAATPEYLDLLVITNANKVFIWERKADGKSGPTQESRFDSPGDYEFEISIVSSNSPSISVRPVLKWRGLQQNAQMTCPAANT
jgi:hypothetical protein